MSDLVLLNHVTTPEWWAPVVPLLRDNVRITHLDVPGFGDAALAGPPSLQAMARGVRDTLVERGLSAAHVAGISMAGSVAVEVARLRGCDRVTAISPPGFWRALDAAIVVAEVGSLWSGVRFASPLVDLAGRNARARTQFWNRLVAHPERVPEDVADRLVLGVAHRMRHLTTGPRALAALSRVIAGYRVAPLDGAVPVTIAWGDHDRFTSYRTQAAQARRVLPHARHVTLTDCGHIPTYDHPDQVARVLAG
jgi:pimeloyl-ACP methyl ester carboxylesterase